MRLALGRGERELESYGGIQQSCQRFLQQMLPYVNVLKDAAGMGMRTLLVGMIPCQATGTVFQQPCLILVREELPEELD